MLVHTMADMIYGSVPEMAKGREIKWIRKCFLHSDTDVLQTNDIIHKMVLIIINDFIGSGLLRSVCPELVSTGTLELYTTSNVEGFVIFFIFYNNDQN